MVERRDGQAAIGTEVDNRDRLWVAGGATGLGRVYDTKSGEQLAQWQFVAAGASNFRQRRGGNQRCRLFH